MRPKRESESVTEISVIDWTNLQVSQQSQSDTPPRALMTDGRQHSSNPAIFATCGGKGYQLQSERLKKALVSTAGVRPPAFASSHHEGHYLLIKQSGPFLWSVG